MISKHKRKYEVYLECFHSGRTLDEIVQYFDTDELEDFTDYIENIKQDNRIKRCYDSIKYLDLDTGKWTIIK